MEMITAKEAAERWGVTPRFVQMLCKEGSILGATQWGRTWMIPADAMRPAESKRKREGVDKETDMPMPRKTPFLDMTDLYHTPGCAKECVESLTFHREAQVLMEAEIAFLRGEIDEVYERASYLLQKHSGFYAVLSAGMLLGLCALWKGDMGMWNKAKLHIFEAPCKNDNDRDIVSLSLTAIDSAVYDTTSFPDWFKIGNFEPLHPDALPAAKVFYAKYLYTEAYAVASKQYSIQGIEGLSLMGMIPYSIEPMVSQAAVDRMVIPEIYLRLTCAAAYHNSGNDAQAIRHLDRAIGLVLPDGLFGVLAEHKRSLDSLLDARLAAVAGEEVRAKVHELYKQYAGGWAKLSGKIRNRNIETSLTMREREVAKLAAFGFSNAEIAERLHLSLASVKQSVRIAAYKGGVNSRAELATIL